MSWLKINDPSSMRVLITALPLTEFHHDRGLQPHIAEGFADGQRLVFAYGGSSPEAFDSLVQVCPQFREAMIEYEPLPEPAPSKHCHSCGEVEGVNPLARYKITFSNTGDDLIRDLCPPCEAEFLKAVVSSQPKEIPDAF